MGVCCSAGLCPWPLPPALLGHSWVAHWNPSPEAFFRPCFPPRALTLAPHFHLRTPFCVPAPFPPPLALFASAPKPFLCSGLVLPCEHVWHLQPSCRPSPSLLLQRNSFFYEKTNYCASIASFLYISCSFALSPQQTQVPLTPASSLNPYSEPFSMLHGSFCFKQLSCAPVPLP